MRVYAISLMVPDGYVTIQVTVPDNMRHSLDRWREIWRQVDVAHPTNRILSYLEVT